VTLPRGTTRRDFLRTIGGGAVLASPFAALACVPAMSPVAGRPERKSEGRGWDLMPEILSRIVPPTFPDRDFEITNFGARADGRTDNTAAIHRAIDACAAAGGGRVVVPAGRFLTAAIHLKSRVNLHVAKNATLAFVQDRRAICRPSSRGSKGPS